ncbi:hypothetical protein ARMSODRAFT_1007454 [Armillaria solidipes]|uniref:Uncharacterized protein n=1 Tax=Armillaria solidipes TaxID=1076256 RepID=A0A2H3AZ56_9AGAR|nr:hypothetical protein ARMSODRAFT_1007454 [Armillaria solidipes]
MNYEGINTSKRSRSDSESSSLPPRKRSSPSLLLDERLSREDVERIVEVYLTRGPHDGLTEALLMQDDPGSRSLHVPILAIFAEQLLRFIGPYKKTEIDFLKINSSNLRGILQADEDVFDLVLNAARPIRLPQPTYEYLKDFGGGRGNLASAAVLAWSSPYIGNHPAAIIAEIEDRLATPNLDGYGYIGAMIQSSGTGKSRTMYEIAARVFTIPINIRKDSGGAPYPDPDAELRDCLIFPGLDPQFQYLCFLCVLFQKVREVLKILVGDEPGEDTALRWRSYLDEPIHRELLYGAIYREARSVRFTITLRHLKLDVTSSDKVKLTKRTKEAYRDLINTLAVDPNKKLKLLIYIDEAHTLMERGIIARMMANLDDPDHFIMFMSTSEVLSLPKSHNLIVRAATLPAPFTVLPFDVCANIEYHDPELTFERIRSIQHLGRFGRPMWHTMLAASALAQWIIFLARTKLTHRDCAETAKFGIHLGEPATVMSGTRLCRTPDVFMVALVDIRVMIEYDPRLEESRWLQKEMVRAHMRMVFSSPANREYTTSGYPSEAILAEAAAISIYEEQVDVVEVVHCLVEDDLLDNSEQGQLVARLILTKAWDAAIHRLLLDKKHPPMPVSHQDKQAVYSRPILLFDFLTALLPEEHLPNIFQSMPDNRVGGPTFAEAFEFAYVHFTHFGRAGSSDVINSGSGIAAFIRGMAYQCSFGHSDIDIFIPLLIVPKDVATRPDFDVDRLPLDQFQSSGIMISVKDEPNFYAWDSTISAEELGFWLDEDTEVDVPYVVISMHLAGTRSPLVSSSSEGSPTTPLTPSSETETPLDTETNLQRPSDRKVHPRYTINISGCSPSVYKVIDANEHHKYSRILSPSGILNDYPYKSPASAALLKKMKPVWSLDPTCFDWAHGMPGVGIVTERQIVLGITYGRQAVTIEEEEDDDSDVQMNDEVNITTGYN